jgi:hypothetical protein
MPRCEMRTVSNTIYNVAVASLTRYTLATESVLGVIERQRRDQERMLRALANG